MTIIIYIQATKVDGSVFMTLVTLAASGLLEAYMFIDFGKKSRIFTSAIDFIDNLWYTNHEELLSDIKQRTFQKRQKLCKEKHA